MENIKNTSKAFSLIELLLGLLIVTIIFAAMVPVLTKARKDTSESPLNKAQNRYVGWVLNEDGSILPIGNKDGSGNLEIPKDVDVLFLTMTGSGGGGGRANRETFAVAYFDTTTTGTWIVPDGVVNVKITLQGGGGGGGAGGGNDATNQEDYFVPAVFNGGSPLCIKRHNIGDIRSLLKGADTNPEMINKIGRNLANDTTFPPGKKGGIIADTTPLDKTFSTVFPPTSYDSCVYSGTNPTASGGSAAGSTTGYSGNWRTVCTYAAAEKACASLDGGWRLLSLQEIGYLALPNNHVQSLGFNLCSNGTGTGLEICTTSSAPNTVSRFWVSGTPAARGYCDVTTSGNISTDNCSTTSALSESATTVHSTRCAKTTKTCDFDLGRSGSGGGGGGYVEVILPTVQPGDKISYTVGLGGTGAALQNGNSTSGTSSVVSVERKNDSGVYELLYTVTAAGGAGGVNATTAAHGNGTPGGSTAVVVAPGSTTTVNTEKEVDGQGSFKVNDTDHMSVSKGGDSGASIAKNSLGGFGAGGSSNIARGPNVEVQTGITGYGAGGSGGWYKTAKAGSGSQGFVTIQYDVIAPGGGGGAGAWLYNYQIKVNKPASVPTEYTIGASGLAGADGGPTKIKIGNNTYTAGGGFAGSEGTISGTHAANNVKINEGTGGNGGNGGTMTLPSGSSLCSNQPQNCGNGNNGSKGASSSGSFKFAGGTGGGSFDYTTDVTTAQGKSITGMGLSGGTSGCKGPSIDTSSICSGTMAPLFDRFVRLGGGGGGNGIACWRDGCETSRGGDGFIFLAW